MAAIGPFEQLAEGIALDFGPIERVGTCLRVLARARRRVADTPDALP
jgi:hypothetical protein